MFVHRETRIVVSYTSSAVCKITRLAGKMALGGSPLTMTDVCTGMATWMLTGMRVTLISTCAAS